MDLGKLSLIPEWYAGFNSRSGEATPLAFLTPNGDDKAALKRKGTVDSWRSKTIPPRVLKSTPLIGYKIDSIAYRYSSFGGGMDKWRITDPRGFQLEITSDNILYLMSCANINNLEIDETCVWVRKGTSSLALLPVSSQLYRDLVAEAMKKAEEAKSPKPKEKSITFGSLKPGDRIHTSVYRGALYIGTFSAIAGDFTSEMISTYIDSAKFPDVKNTRYHLLKYRASYEVVTSAKINSVVSADVELTPEEITSHVVQALDYKNRSYDMRYKGIIAFSDTKKNLSLDIKTSTIPASWFLDRIDHNKKIEQSDIPACQSAFVKINGFWKYIPGIYDAVNDYLEVVRANSIMSKAAYAGGIVAALTSVLNAPNIYRPLTFYDVTGSVSFTAGEALDMKRGSSLVTRSHNATILDLLRLATDVIVLDITASGIVQGTTLEYHSNP